MATLSRKSYTRVTLALDIVGKIQEGEFAGYHELGIVKHLISLHDVIDVVRSSSMKISCDTPGVPRDESNVCWKAAVTLKEAYNISDNAEIRIEKQIPVQGGLAGGSANAATTMMLLNEMWELGLSTEELCRLGRKVGMDVPFYFVSGTAFDSEATGVLQPIRTDITLNLVLAIPDFGVSTKAAYGEIEYTKIGKEMDRTNTMRLALENNDHNGVIANLHNDFELSVFPAYPQLQALKERLLNAGCLNVVMSGSGSTLIGIASDELHAQQVCHTIGGMCLAVKSL